MKKEDYKCSICKNKFTSIVQFKNQEPLCSEKCAKKYVLIFDYIYKNNINSLIDFINNSTK